MTSGTTEYDLFCTNISHTIGIQLGFPEEKIMNKILAYWIENRFARRATLPKELGSSRIAPAAFIKHHSFAVFVVLAYLLSWWSAPFAEGQIIPYGPALAGVIVLAVTAGRPGLRDLWRRITNWRVAWYWYLVGPGMIASYVAGAYMLNLALGASVTIPPQLPSMGILLELLLLGGMWEEPGWSGYALPKLQQRFARRSDGVLIATLLTAVIRSIWHLPLVIYGHIHWFDALIFSFAFQIMISWLFNRSGGSVLIVMVFHFASNVIGGGIMHPVFTGASQTSYYALMVTLASITALVILWKSRLKLGKGETKTNPALADRQVV
jgi:uncharacterized protein